MLEVCRTSDRVIAVTILLSDNVWTIVSAYAPQVGCDEDTKNAFWNELEAVIMKVPHKEKLALAGDLNGHVGESRYDSSGGMEDLVLEKEMKRERENVISGPNF